MMSHMLGARQRSGKRRYWNNPIEKTSVKSVKSVPKKIIPKNPEKSGRNSQNTAGKTDVFFVVDFWGLGKYQYARTITVIFFPVIQGSELCQTKG